MITYNLQPLISAITMISIIATLAGCQSHEPAAVQTHLPPSTIDVEAGNLGADEESAHTRYASVEAHHFDIYKRYRTVVRTAAIRALNGVGVSARSIQAVWRPGADAKTCSFRTLLVHENSMETEMSVAALTLIEPPNEIGFTQAGKRPSTAAYRTFGIARDFDRRPLHAARIEQQQTSGQ